MILTQDEVYMLDRSSKGETTRGSLAVALGGALPSMPLPLSMGVIVTGVEECAPKYCSNKVELRMNLCF